MKLKILFMNICSFISLKLYYSLSYYYNRKKIINLKRPTNLSEYIISKIVNREIDKVYELTDKYAVREYVSQKGFRSILTKLYGYWTSVEDIDFDKLPNSFALKCNFGCGFNVICFDKANFSREDIVSRLNDWMSIRTFYRSEPHYDLVKKSVLCEELIQDYAGVLPIDYKFMCVNGKPHHILVITERSGHTMKLFTYSLTWERIDNLLENDFLNNENICRPNNLNQMVEISEKLSKDFDFVRVDLYDTGDKVYFGELTFTPQGGLLRYYTIEALELMVKELIK